MRRCWQLLGTAVVLVGFANGALAYERADLSEDLGFTSGLNTRRTGWLTGKAFSVQDSDAIFIINNVPLLYKTPRNPLMLSRMEERFQIALEGARANSDQDWHALAVLLEGTATFYRKLNRRADSLSLSGELVDLLTEHVPRSQDLCNAQIALGQTLTASHQYQQAELSFKEALSIAQDIFGMRHVQVATINSHLYFLYLDMGRTDLAVKSRRDALAASSLDVVAAEEQKVHDQSASTWPSIVKSIEGVSTSQEVAANEQDADRQALDALGRYQAGIDPNAAPAKPKAPKSGKDKDKEDEPIVPYRLQQGNGAY